MNILANPLADAQKVWNNVKGAKEPRATLGKATDIEGEGAVFTFITPSIIALGKFNEKKVPELLSSIGSRKALIWNLSGKSIHPVILSKLNYQLMDVPWVTPGQFTQAPSLECVFAQCYALKSWLDIGQDHVIVVHCTNGRSRTGILISCFLKYIGAFSGANAAFDFFCDKRISHDVVPSLNPSYRILFENVDKAVEQGDYPNPFPLHLKCLAISSLPVEDVPCVEVWDRRGIIFSSHAGDSPVPDRSNWSAEFGDGFFHVDSDIVGDFSVMCRFGGSHAMIRDKSTLIFRYQNSTAFLPADVSELKRSNVDINPEYSDSLDLDTFAMHLMFEPAVESTLSSGKRSPRKALPSVLDPLYTFPARGKEAFEAGLDEISKHHVLEPDPAKFSQLADQEGAATYSTVALQLTGNDVLAAIKVMGQMRIRAMDLSGAVRSPPKGGKKGNPDSNAMKRMANENVRNNMHRAVPFVQPGSRGVSKSGPVARNNMIQTFGEYAGFESTTGMSTAGLFGSGMLTAIVGPDVGHTESSVRVSSPLTLDTDIPTLPHVQRSGQASPSFQPRAPSSPLIGRSNGIGGEHSFLVPDKKVGTANNNLNLNGSISNTSRADSAENLLSAGSGTSGGDAGNCRVCNSNEYVKRDQLISCSSCHHKYHTHCTGNRRIPFTIKSTKERQSHEKYISKYYGTWLCPDCSVPGEGAKAAVDAASVSVSYPKSTGSGLSPQNFRGSIDGSRSPHFQPSGGVLFSSTDETGSGGDVSVSQPKSPLPVDSRRSSISVPRPSSLNISSSPSGRVGSSSIGIPVLGSGNGTGGNSTGSNGPVDDASKLLNVLLSKGITLENLASMSPDDQKNALSAAIASIGNNTGSGSGLASGTGAQAKLGGGDMSKYKKMISIGVSKSAVATCMRADNVDPSLLFGGEAEGLGHGRESGGKSGPGGVTGGGSHGLGDGGSGEGTGTGEGNQTEESMIEVDPKYVKYLNLIKVGIPRVSVALKMVAEKICSTKEEALRVIDSSTQHGPAGKGQGSGGGNGVWYLGPGNGGGKPGSPNGRGGGGWGSPGKDGGGGGGGGTIAIKDHPLYAKYFKMLKAGLPEVAVKAKMLQDGLDTAMLEKDPNDQIPYDGPGGIGGGGYSPGKPEEPKVNLEDHPKYQKYFKMLKVGLPVETVKTKMEAEGLNPSVLDQDPLSKVSPNEDIVKKEGEGRDASGGTNKVAVKDHPKYAKYFKMLKVGLAKPAVQAKMTQEGVDPSILDKDPNELIDASDGADKKDAAVDSKKIAAKDHPKYAKYFKMLKVGLAKPTVQAKMAQEGVDPAILDHNPDDLIDAAEVPKEEKQVAAQDHPKYAKYFRMLKVGLAKAAVQAKMTQEGVDASILEKNPTDLIPLEDSGSAGANSSPKKVVVKEKVRKKKLHWKALETVAADSVWAAGGDSDDEFKLDEAEFKELFTEKAAEAKQKESKVSAPASKRASVITLIDMKRSQNAGIALARIKLSFPALKERIRVMDATNLSTDQLRSLEEFLPSAEEKAVLSNYKGETKSLGKAEQYMIEMMDFKGAVKRIECMVFRQNFSNRVTDIRANIEKISEACNDVKLSDRLRRVLKVILKVGNQINDGDKQAGFTLDSLLKLHTAKAYDKKTSVLQYIVSLISRNDSDILLFPEDLSNVSAASKVMLDTVASDLTNVRLQWDSCRKVVDNIATLAAATAKRNEMESKSLEENKKVVINETTDAAAGVISATASKNQTMETMGVSADIEIGTLTPGIKQNCDPGKSNGSVEANEKKDIDTRKCVDNAKVDSADGNKKLPDGIEASEAKIDMTEDEGVAEMSKFLDSAKEQCQALEKIVSDTKAKYKSVLNYFAADEKMASQDFFSTLSKFIQMFVETREVVDRLKRAEEKKAKLENTAAAALLARAESGEGSNAKPASLKRPMRRSSAIVTSSTATTNLVKNSVPVDVKAPGGSSTDYSDDKTAKGTTEQTISPKRVTASAADTDSVTSPSATSPKESINKMKSMPNAAMRRKSTFS